MNTFSPSDINLKENIVVIPNAIDKVNAISGNTFTWKSESYNESIGNDTGVIAQEVEALGLPGIVVTRSNGKKAVRYEKLVPLLIEAIKELNNKIEQICASKDIMKAVGMMNEITQQSHAMDQERLERQNQSKSNDEEGDQGPV